MKEDNDFLSMELAGGMSNSAGINKYKLHYVTWILQIFSFSPYYVPYRIVLFSYQGRCLSITME